MTPKKKPKKEVQQPLDPMALMIASELFKIISPLEIEVKDHINRKTIIFDEKTLNKLININTKMAGLNEVKSVELKILDNDRLKIILDIDRYTTMSKVGQILQIDESNVNFETGIIKFSFLENNTQKTNEIISQIVVLLIKHILKTLFLPELLKQMPESTVKIEWQSVSVDLKQSTLELFYNKTLNQTLNTKVPFWSNKKLMELIEIEGFMCENGQLWLEFAYKI